MALIKNLLGAAARVFSCLASAQTPIISKFSHVNPAQSPKNKAAEYFKKLAEDGTQGRVKVEIYPNCARYKAKEELEAMPLGAVQILAPTLGKFSTVGLRDFESFDLPFRFDSFEQAHLITQGPIDKQLFAQLDAKGIKGLAFWDKGFKPMSANRPLVTPADFKGLKMRIFSAKVLDAEMRALEALRALNRIKIITLTTPQRDEWKQVLIKSHEAVADRINRNVRQATYKETGVVGK